MERLKSIVYKISFSNEKLFSIMQNILNVFKKIQNIIPTRQPTSNNLPVYWHIGLEQIHCKKLLVFPRHIQSFYVFAVINNKHQINLRKINVNDLCCRYSKTFIIFEDIHYFPIYTDLDGRIDSLEIKFCGNCDGTDILLSSKKSTAHCQVIIQFKQL